MESIRMGSKGSEVRKLQELLCQQGNKVSIDGEFGTKTRAAVIKFQRAKGITDNGIVGTKTWDALEKKNYRLYPGKVDEIAQRVIRGLCDKSHIEVDVSRTIDAQLDLVAIMNEYMRRDRQLRVDAKERMQILALPYGHFGKTLRILAKERRHPLGDRLQVYLANQFINNFLNSPNIEEVYEQDNTMRKEILDILDEYRVNEDEIREEAKKLIRNVKETDLQYDLELSKKMVEVRRKRGLLKE